LPTPQIGGVIIIPIYLAFTLAFSEPSFSFHSETLVLIYAPLALAIVGFADDRYGLPVLLRLTLFTAIATCAIFSPELQKSLSSHYWLTPFLLVFAVLSFLNFTNFMDGMDGMLVVEFVPIFSLLLILSSLGHVVSLDPVALMALLAVLLGFACFNRPPAKLFMGDSGSLSLGFLVAFFLVQVALEKNYVSAILPPLYFIADTCLTLAKRIIRGEKIWRAHRQHAYQRAMDSGQSVVSILIRILLANITLCFLSYWALDTSAPKLALVVLAGGIVVLLLFLSLERRRELP
jgi:UDP-N-acetylmuramyl pentapeptide phosphotransferase/UDP-N-acetylglucosamine-1-phosphate transferase